MRILKNEKIEISVGPSSAALRPVRSIQTNLKSSKNKMSAVFTAFNYYIESVLKIFHCGEKPRTLGYMYRFKIIALLIILASLS